MPFENCARSPAIGWVRICATGWILPHQEGYRLGAADRPDEGLAEMVAWGRKYVDQIRTGRPTTRCAPETKHEPGMTKGLRKQPFRCRGGTPRCLVYRKRILDISQQVTALHVAPAFSCLEMVDVIYHGLMRRDPQHHVLVHRRVPDVEGPWLHVAIRDPRRPGNSVQDDLDQYCKPEGRLGAHPDYGVPGIEASTGSLGHGMGIATGMAYAEKLKGPTAARTSCFPMANSRKARPGRR